jgi:hypothetical protein
MADRAANRYRHRARDLVQRAKDLPAECDRRHMLELAATYERTADSLVPVPASSEAQSVFRPPQPIEQTLAKVGVEGSNPFARSNYINCLASNDACDAPPGKQGVSSARDPHCPRDRSIGIG